MRPLAAQSPAFVYSFGSCGSVSVHRSLPLVEAKTLHRASAGCEVVGSAHKPGSQTFKERMQHFAALCCLNEFYNFMGATGATWQHP
jgi:hypothetical protein